MYVPRTIEKTILSVSSSFPCVAVYGPRQVGKSTTIECLFGNRMQRVSLDDLEDRHLARQEPKRFLEFYRWPLIIDEIQKAPELLDAIKMVIDEQRLKWMREERPRSLMYILTGSSRFELQQGISDSLAGRCGIVDMSSFSQAEKYGAEGALFTPDPEKLMERERTLRRYYRTRSQIFEDIFRGGMPDIVTGVAERETYFRSYVSTYIEKDVRKLISAGSEMQFHNFLSIVALRTAQELRYDAIAAAVGVDVRTCKRWISILETSGIVFLLHPYMANLSNRIIKAPKLFFMDTGLCAYLCKWPSAEMLEQCAMSGAFFETFVVSEMIKNHYAHNKDPKEMLFFYRDIDQKEVDLIYVERDKLYPIEIKQTGSPKNPSKTFRALEKYKMEIGQGLVIDTCDKIRPLDEAAFSYPAYLLGC